MINFDIIQTDETLKGFCIHQKNIYKNGDKKHIVCYTCEYNACVIGRELRSIRLELDDSSIYIYQDSFLVIDNKIENSHNDGPYTSQLHYTVIPSPIDTMTLKSKLSAILLLL